METVEGANSSTTVSLVVIRKVDVAKFLFRIIYIIINQFLHLSCMGVAERNVKRTIWLQSSIKLFTRAIGARIAETFDNAQPVEQAGFRKEFCTMDHTDHGWWTGWTQLVFSWY